MIPALLLSNKSHPESPKGSHMRANIVIVGGLWAFGFLSIASAENWSQFRGAGGKGVSDGKSSPIEWTASRNVLWKAKIPGSGWSSPVVWGERVFLTTVKKASDSMSSWEVFCVDRQTGKVVWNQVAREGKPRTGTHGSNGFATETPVTDGERLYAYFGMHGVYCYDLDGKLLWEKDLGAFPTENGSASSPAFDGKRLFIQIDNDQKSFIVALDARTGDEVWRADRDEKTTHASPVMWKNRVRTELVTPGAKKARSYDPATGKVLWELNHGGRCNASPVSDNDRLYIAGGKIFAVNAGASGELSDKPAGSANSGIAWTRPRGDLDSCSPIVYRDHFYFFGTGGGFVTCCDVTTGKEVYRERLPGARGFWSSPVACDGKVYCLDDAGTTYVLEAGPEFKLLAQNSIKGEFRACPVVADGVLILRAADGVYAIK